MKQVKQQEIARKLKLSKATVSRCFTNHPGINPQTRALVFETATELGYHHLSSRTIKNEVEQKVFGVLISTSEEEYNRSDYINSGKDIFKGISEYSQLKNIKLSIKVAIETLNGKRIFGIYIFFIKFSLFIKVDND